jgi:hypothetical protein
LQQSFFSVTTEVVTDIYPQLQVKLQLRFFSVASGVATKLFVIIKQNTKDHLYNFYDKNK